MSRVLYIVSDEYRSFGWISSETLCVSSEILLAPRMWVHLQKFVYPAAWMYLRSLSAGSWIRGLLNLLVDLWWHPHKSFRMNFMYFELRCFQAWRVFWWYLWTIHCCLVRCRRFFLEVWIFQFRVSDEFSSELVVSDESYIPGLSSWCFKAYWKSQFIVRLHGS